MPEHGAAPEKNEKEHHGIAARVQKQSFFSSVLWFAPCLDAGLSCVLLLLYLSFTTSILNRALAQVHLTLALPC
jgi:hypothetical protein